MKVVHVVESLERGGLERMVVNLVLAQHAAGHACRVICLYRAGILAGELEDAGIAVECCHKRDGLDLRALTHLRRLLARQGGGVLHSHNAVAHYHAAIAAIGLGFTRVLNTRHSMSSRHGSGRAEWLYRRSMALTDCAVAVCEAARERLRREGVRPRRGVLAIPNGIHVEAFEPATAASRKALADQLGLAAGTRVIGTVGRLTAVKDQRTLIAAFARIHAQVPATALVLVGDGELRGALEAKAAAAGVADAVHFVGDRHDVGALLAGFDVFALSSLTEGYSMALLEACAAGLPIVATAVGGNAEIVRDGINGRLVPMADPTALAEAVLAILRMPAGCRTAMGRAGAEWVVAEGSVSAMAARYLALYAASA